MIGEAFILYRNEVIGSLNKFGVQYKVVGGTIIQLLESSRMTGDLDIVIMGTQDNLNKLISALVFCKFASQEDLQKQLDGIGTPHGYSAYELTSSNLRWSDYHIDLCLALGQHNYQTMPNETHYTSTNLPIHSVPFKFIAHMKHLVYPKPRNQDLKDIGIICKHLGLNPETLEPD